MKLRLLVALAGVLLAFLRGGMASAQVPLRRFVVLAAANEGGPGRARLAYAHSDAASFQAVLQELGGVSPSDAISLKEPRPDELDAAFTRLRARLAQARSDGARVEFIFYYSGHSDEQGLLLGRQRLTYGALRTALDAMPADVRLGILDSCASGAMTRKKGGVRRPAFLYDEATQTRGHAFLTSASEDEAAQESDRIGGSFFTHHLISGLRGAADASGDGKVTLSEAYRFAFEETLLSTGSTSAGAQHPAYEMQLAGTGDLVLTDLRTGEAQLNFGATLAGRLFVWNARGGLVSELDKPAQRTLGLALPAGGYLLSLNAAGTQRVAKVKLHDKQVVVVESAQFTEVPTEQTTRRGGALGQVSFVPFAASLIPPYSTLAQRPAGTHFDFALLYDDPEALEGFALSLGGTRARQYARGMQLGVAFADTNLLWGLSLAGFASVVRTGAYGIQLAGLIALSSQETRGLQVSPVTFARELVGNQLAPGINVVARHALGAQVGTVNFARYLRGAQLGAINLARHVRGLQIGALNVAASEVRGVQIGLVNYADDADVSLGVLGITRKGGVHPQLSVADSALLTGALRFDARYNYSFVAAGVHPLGPGAERSYSVGAGLGAKARLLRELMWLDIDLGAHVVQAFSGWRTGIPNALFQLRSLVRVDVHRHFSVLAGPALSVLLQTDPAHRVRPGFEIDAHELTHVGSSARVLIWPGFVAGLRL